MMYKGLADYIEKSLEKNTSIYDMFHSAKQKYGYPNNFKQFQEYIRGVKKRRKLSYKVNYNSENKIKKDVDLFLEVLSSTDSIPLTDICNKFDCSPKIIEEFIAYHRSKGVEIVSTNDIIGLANKIKRVDKVELLNDPLEEKEIIFGVASDLHFGSKHVQITALNKFCNICKEKGVKYIFSPGDITAGHNVYPGQQMDLYAIGAEAQQNSVILNLPKGFEWKMLGGNHDYSFVKKNGHNPLRVIEYSRPDVHFCGFDTATISLLPGVDLMMWHPSGGVPYARSYRLQKAIEQISFKELSQIASSQKSNPSIRFVLCGHLHIQLQAMFGSILGVLCGAFEGETGYLTRKGLVPNIGGYIIEASLGRNGLLKSFNTKFYVFEEIKDDWIHYNHDIKEQNNDLTSPIFGSW